MSQQIKIHVFHTGTVTVDKNLPFHHPGQGPLAFLGLTHFRKRDKVEIPVSSYLIEHPRGLVLIDTGWNTVNRSRRGQIRNLSFQYPANQAKLPAGQAINEQLNAIGIQPHDLDYVLLSHLHCDHADGLALVKDAQRILVSEEEWYSANHDRVRYLPHEWKNVPVHTFKLRKTGLGAYGRSFDLFGDESIQMIWEPGHSVGLCATKIQLPGQDKYVMLAADGGYAAKSWQENLTPGLVVNRFAAQKSLDFLKETAKDPNCVECLANHDPNVQPHTITFK